MPLIISIEDRLHRQIGEAIVDSDGSIENFCSVAAPGSFLGDVDPVAETMFNEHQIPAIIDELEQLVPRNESESDSIRILRDSAIAAAKKGGKLWFRSSSIGR